MPARQYNNLPDTEFLSVPLLTLTFHRARVLIVRPLAVHSRPYEHLHDGNQPESKYARDAG